jgi:hypothetical protein
MSAKAQKTITAESVTLPAASGWRKLPLIGAALALLGIGGTLAVGGPDHANYFAYTTAFLYFLTIALGGLFFVMIFFLTRSGWNVALRRLAENFAFALPVFALLFLPVLLGMDHIYHWMDPQELANDEILQFKSPYLNKGFFLARAAFYLLAWTGLAWFFRSQSTRQDTSGDVTITRRLQAMAAPGIAIGALTLTFAAFDWNMSIDYHWFSTMYGVIHFAGGFMGAFALLIIFVYLLDRQNLLGGAVTLEHYHGMGKMLFGLNCFWAYVSFSQFMLIWYANIPEETLWYAHRMEGAWFGVTVLLGVGHFVIPFFFLMSHHIKRRPALLVAGAVWLLAMHYLDLYWMVMPAAYPHGAHFGVAEVLSFIGVGGAFLGAVGFAMTRNPLVAVKDPRLPESLAFEN